MSREVRITFILNGVGVEIDVEPRVSLADLLRDKLGLTGTHLGCEQGVCGACTVLLDGYSVRSCLMLGVQADGHEVTTIEGIQGNPVVNDLMSAMSEYHGLQCGYCTPGIVVSLFEYLSSVGEPLEEEIRATISGNICRCTGYSGIVKAVMKLAQSETVLELTSMKGYPDEL